MRIGIGLAGTYLLLVATTEVLERRNGQDLWIGLAG
jgi:hypothetical protein